MKQEMHGSQSEGAQFSLAGMISLPETSVSTL